MDKVSAIVYLDICPETGARIYNLHPKRELGYDDKQILDKPTGLNRFNEEEPNQPHATWESILRPTISKSQPRGIKGSTKLI